MQVIGKQTLDEQIEVVSLDELKQEILADEERGLDAPFATFTWQGWQEMQARLMQNITRFQRAIEHGKIDVAFIASLEVQEIATSLMKEAGSWTGLGGFHPKSERH